MKKFFFKISVLAICVLLIVKVNAQSYTLTTGNVFTINMGFNDLQYDGLEWTNSSSQTLDLYWERIEVDTVPGSTFDMCASGDCQMFIPPTGSYNAYPTLPGQVGFLKMHFWTGNTPGVSKARIYIYESSAPNNGDTLTFILNINQANAINQNSINNNLISVYPNPANDYLHINFNGVDIEKVKEIKIVNTIGQVVFIDSQKIVDNQKIDVSGLSNGVYLLQLTNYNNNIIQTKKIIINHK